MAIVDGTKPVQAVSCDLCGTIFDRPLKVKVDSWGGIWKDVSIAIFPNVGEPQGLFGVHASIKIEHACDVCRESFTEKVRSLIDEFRKNKEIS